MAKQKPDCKGGLDSQWKILTYLNSTTHFGFVAATDTQALPYSRASAWVLISPWSNMTYATAPNLITLPQISDAGIRACGYWHGQAEAQL